MTSEAVPPAAAYPARLEIEFPERLDRFTTLLRILYLIPIGIIYALLERFGDDGLTLSAALWVATVLMLVFRRRYPRWWFDTARELYRFGLRVLAYLALLTDRYPSTDDPQAVRLELDYPDVQRDLDRWLPLVKWLLALPHYVVLLFLCIGAIGAVVIAWWAILFTGRYPRSLFDYVVGVMRWSQRVSAYAFLLTTDRYPPFSLR